MDVRRFSLPPAHPLAPWLAGVWSLRARAAYRSETVLPRGNVALVFNLGDALAAPSDASRLEAMRAGRAYLSGLQTRPFEVAPVGEVHLVGLNLRPEACAALFGVPAGAVAEARVEAGAALGPEAQEMCERLADADGFEAQSALLVAWLVGRLRPAAEHEWTRRACEALRGARGEGCVRELARAWGLSERHLRRRFSEQVGIGPMRFARLSRFGAALGRIPAARTLSAAAHAAGYYDQAHLCRDFRAFAGMTPEAFRRGVVGGPGRLLRG